MCFQWEREAERLHGNEELRDAGDSANEPSQEGLMYFYCLSDTEAVKVLETTSPDRPAFLMYVHPAGGVGDSSAPRQEKRRCRSQEPSWVTREVTDCADRKTRGSVALEQVRKDIGDSVGDTPEREQRRGAEGRKEIEPEAFSHRGHAVPSYVNVVYRCPLTRLISTCSFWFPCLCLRSASLCSSCPFTANESESSDVLKAFPCCCSPTRIEIEKRGAAAREMKTAHAEGDRPGCRARVDALTRVLHGLQEALESLYASFLFRHHQEKKERVGEELLNSADFRAFQALEICPGRLLSREHQNLCSPRSERSAAWSSLHGFFATTTDAPCRDVSVSPALSLGNRRVRTDFSQNTLAPLVRWAVLLLVVVMTAECRRQHAKEGVLRSVDECHREIENRGSIDETRKEARTMNTGDDEYPGRWLVGVVLLGLAVEENLSYFSQFVWLRWLRALRHRPEDWETAATLPLLLASSDGFLRQLLAAAPLVFPPLASCLSVVHRRALAFVTATSCNSAFPEALSSSLSRSSSFAEGSTVNLSVAADVWGLSRTVPEAAFRVGGAECQLRRSSSTPPDFFRRAWATQRALLCAFDTLVSYAVDNLIPFAALQINLFCANPCLSSLAEAGRTPRCVDSLASVRCQLNGISGLRGGTAGECHTCSGKTWSSCKSACVSSRSGSSARSGEGWPAVSAAPDLRETLNLLAGIRDALPLSLALNFLLAPSTSPSWPAEVRPNRDFGEPKNNEGAETQGELHRKQGKGTECASDASTKPETAASVKARHKAKTPSRLNPVSMDGGFIKECRSTVGSSVQSVSLGAFYEVIRPLLFGVRRRCSFRSADVEHSTAFYSEETSAPVTPSKQSSTCDGTRWTEYCVQHTADLFGRLLFFYLHPTRRAPQFPSFKSGTGVQRSSGNEQQGRMRGHRRCYPAVEQESTPWLRLNWQAAERDASACTWKWVVLYSRAGHLLDQASTWKGRRLGACSGSLPAEGVGHLPEVNQGDAGVPVYSFRAGGRVIVRASTALEETGAGGRSSRRSASSGTPAARNSTGEFSRLRSTLRGVSWPCCTPGLRSKNYWGRGLTKSRGEGSCTVDSEADWKWVEQGGARGGGESAKTEDTFLVMLTSLIEKQVAVLVGTTLSDPQSPCVSSFVSPVRPGYQLALSCTAEPSTFPWRCRTCQADKRLSERSTVFSYKMLSSLLHTAASYVDCAVGGSSSVAIAALQMLQASLSRLSICLSKSPLVSSSSQDKALCLFHCNCTSLSSNFFGLVASFFFLVSTLLRALTFSPSHLCFIFRLLDLLCLLPDTSPYRQRPRVSCQRVQGVDRLRDHISWGFPRGAHKAGQSQQTSSRRPGALKTPSLVKLSRRLTPSTRNRSLSDAVEQNTPSSDRAHPHEHRPLPSSKSSGTLDLYREGHAGSSRTQASTRSGYFVPQVPGTGAVTAGDDETVLEGGDPYSLSSLISICFSESAAHSACLLREQASTGEWANNRDNEGNGRVVLTHSSSIHAPLDQAHSRGSNLSPKGWRPLDDRTGSHRANKCHACFMESLSSSLHEARMSATRLLEALVVLVTEHSRSDDAVLTRGRETKRKESPSHQRGPLWGIRRHARLQEQKPGPSIEYFPGASSPWFRHRQFKERESGAQEESSPVQGARTDQGEQQTEEDVNSSCCSGTHTPCGFADNSVPSFWSTRVKEERTYMRTAVAPFLLDWMRFFFQPPVGIFHSFIRSSQEQLLSSTLSSASQGSPAPRSVPPELSFAPPPVVRPPRVSASSPLTYSPNPAPLGPLSTSVQSCPLPPETRPSPLVSHRTSTVSSPCATAPHSPGPTSVQCGARLECTTTANARLAVQSSSSIPSEDTFSPRSPPSALVEAGAQGPPSSAADAHRGTDREPSCGMFHWKTDSMRTRELLLQLLSAEQALLMVPTSAPSPYSSGSMLVMFVDLHYLGFLVSYCCNEKPPEHARGYVERDNVAVDRFLVLLAQLHVHALLLIAAKRSTSALQRLRSFRVLDFLVAHLLPGEGVCTPGVSSTTRLAPVSAPSFSSPFPHFSKCSMKPTKSRSRTGLLVRHRHGTSRRERRPERQQSSRVDSSPALRVCQGNKDGRLEGVGDSKERHEAESERVKCDLESGRKRQVLPGEGRHEETEGDEAHQTGKWRNVKQGEKAQHKTRYGEMNAGVRRRSSALRTGAKQKVTGCGQESPRLCSIDEERRPSFELSSSPSSDASVPSSVHLKGRYAHRCLRPCSSPSAFFSSTTQSDSSSIIEEVSSESDVTLSSLSCPSLAGSGRSCSASILSSSSRTDSSSLGSRRSRTQSSSRSKSRLSSSQNMSFSTYSSSSSFSASPSSSPCHDSWSRRHRRSAEDCRFATQSSRVPGDDPREGCRLEAKPLDLQSGGPAPEKESGDRRVNYCKEEGLWVDAAEKRRPSRMQEETASSQHARVCSLSEKHSPGSHGDAECKEGLKRHSKSERRRGRRRRRQIQEESRTDRSSRRTSEAKVRSRLDGTRSRARPPGKLSPSGSVTDASPHARGSSVVSKARVRPFVPPLRLDALPPPASYRELQQPPSEAGPSYGPTRPPTAKALSTHRTRQSPFPSRNGGNGTLRADGRSGQHPSAPMNSPCLVQLREETAGEQRAEGQRAYHGKADRETEGLCLSTETNIRRVSQLAVERAVGGHAAGWQRLAREPELMRTGEGTQGSVACESELGSRAAKDKREDSDAVPHDLADGRTEEESSTCRGRCACPEKQTVEQVRGGKREEGGLQVTESLDGCTGSSAAEDQTCVAQERGVSRRHAARSGSQLCGSLALENGTMESEEIRGDKEGALHLCRQSEQESTSLPQGVTSTTRVALLNEERKNDGPVRAAAPCAPESESGLPSKAAEVPGCGSAVGGGTEGDNGGRSAELVCPMTTALERTGMAASNRDCCRSDGISLPKRGAAIRSPQENHCHVSVSVSERALELASKASAPACRPPAHAAAEESRQSHGFHVRLSLHPVASSSPCISTPPPSSNSEADGNPELTSCVNTPSSGDLRKSRGHRSRGGRYSLETPRLVQGSLVPRDAAAACQGLVLAGSAECRRPWPSVVARRAGALATTEQASLGQFSSSWDGGIITSTIRSDPDLQNTNTGGSRSPPCSTVYPTSREHGSTSPFTLRDAPPDLHQRSATERTHFFSNRMASPLLRTHAIEKVSTAVPRGDSGDRLLSGGHRTGGGLEKDRGYYRQQMWSFIRAANSSTGSLPELANNEARDFHAGRMQPDGKTRATPVCHESARRSVSSVCSVEEESSTADSTTTGTTTGGGEGWWWRHQGQRREGISGGGFLSAASRCAGSVTSPLSPVVWPLPGSSGGMDGVGVPFPVADGANGHWTSCPAGDAGVPVDCSRGTRGAQSTMAGSPADAGRSGQVRTALLSRDSTEHRATLVYGTVPAAPPGVTSSCCSNQLHQLLAKEGAKQFRSLVPLNVDIDGKHHLAAKEGWPFDGRMERPGSARSIMMSASQGTYNTQATRMAAAMKASGCTRSASFEWESTVALSASSIPATSCSTQAETRPSGSNRVRCHDRTAADAEVVCSPSALARSPPAPLEAGSLPLASSGDSRRTFVGQREASMRRLGAPHNSYLPDGPLLTANQGSGRAFTKTDEGSLTEAAAAGALIGALPLETSQPRGTNQPACSSVSCVRSVAPTERIHAGDCSSLGSNATRRISPFASRLGRAPASDAHPTVPLTLQSRDKNFSPSVSPARRAYAGVLDKLSSVTALPKPRSRGSLPALALPNYRNQLDGVKGIGGEGGSRKAAGVFQPAGHNASTPRHLQCGGRAVPAAVAARSRYSWHPQPFEKLCLLTALVTPRLLLQQLKQEGQRGVDREACVGEAGKKGGRWTGPRVQRRAASRPRFTSSNRSPRTAPSIPGRVLFPSSLLRNFGGEGSRWQEVEEGSLRSCALALAKIRSDILGRGERLTCPATSDLAGDSLRVAESGALSTELFWSQPRDCRDAPASAHPRNAFVDCEPNVQGRENHCPPPDYAAELKRVTRRHTVGHGLEIRSEPRSPSPVRPGQLDLWLQSGGALVPGVQYTLRRTAEEVNKYLGENAGEHKLASPASYCCNPPPSSCSGEACSPVQCVSHLPTAGSPETAVAGSGKTQSQSRGLGSSSAGELQIRTVMQVPDVTSAEEKPAEVGCGTWSGPTSSHATKDRELCGKANEVSGRKKEEARSPAHATAPPLGSSSETRSSAPTSAPSACGRTSRETSTPLASPLRPQIPVHSTVEKWSDCEASGDHSGGTLPTSKHSRSDLLGQGQLHTACVQVPGDEKLKQDRPLQKTVVAGDEHGCQGGEDNGVGNVGRLPVSTLSREVTPVVEAHPEMTAGSESLYESSVGLRDKEEEIHRAAWGLGGIPENRSTAAGNANEHFAVDKRAEEAHLRTAVPPSSRPGDDQGMVRLVDEEGRRGVCQVPPLNFAASTGGLAVLASRVAPGVIAAWTEIHCAQRQVLERFKLGVPGRERLEDDRGSRHHCADCHSLREFGQRQSQCPSCSLALLDPLVKGAARAQAESRLCDDSLLHALAISLLISLLVQGKRGLLSADVDEDEAFDALVSPVPSSASRMRSPPLASPSGSPPSTTTHADVTVQTPPLPGSDGTSQFKWQLGFSEEGGQPGRQLLTSSSDAIPTACDMEQAQNNFSLPNARRVEAETEHFSEAAKEPANSYNIHIGSDDHGRAARDSSPLSLAKGPPVFSHFGAAQGGGRLSVVSSARSVPLKETSAFVFARVLPLLQSHLSFFRARAVSRDAPLSCKDQLIGGASPANETVLCKRRKRGASGDRRRGRTKKERHWDGGNEGGHPGEYTRPRVPKNLSKKREPPHRAERTCRGGAEAEMRPEGTAQSTKERMYEGESRDSMTEYKNRISLHVDASRAVMRGRLHNSLVRSLTFPAELEGLSKNSATRNVVNASGGRRGGRKEDPRQGKDKTRDEIAREKKDEETERGTALRRKWAEEKEFMRAVVCLTQRHLGLAGCRLLKLLAAGLFPLTLFKQEEKLGSGMFGSVWKCLTPFQDMSALAMKQVPVPIDEKSHMFLSSMFHEVSCLDAFRLTSPLVCELFDFGIANSDGLLTYCINMKLYSTTLGAWRRALAEEMETHFEILTELRSKPSQDGQREEGALNKGLERSRVCGYFHQSRGEGPDDNWSRASEKCCCGARGDGSARPPFSERAGKTNTENRCLPRSAAAAGEESVAHTPFERKDRGAMTGDKVLSSCDNSRTRFLSAFPSGVDRASHSSRIGNTNEEENDTGVEGDASALALELALLPLTLAIFLQVARAVADLHARGVVHYDLKCDNILVDLDELVPIPHQDLLLPCASAEASAVIDHACDIRCCRVQGGFTQREGAVCWLRQGKNRSPSVLCKSVEISHRRVEKSSSAEGRSGLVLTQAGTLRMPSVAVADFGEARMLASRRRSEGHTARSRGTEVNKSPELLHLAVVWDGEAENEADSSLSTLGILASEAEGEGLCSCSVASASPHRVLRDIAVEERNSMQAAKGDRPHTAGSGGKTKEGRLKEDDHSTTQKGTRRTNCKEDEPELSRSRVCLQRCSLESVEHWQGEQVGSRGECIPGRKLGSKECVRGLDGSFIDWKTRQLVLHGKRGSHSGDVGEESTKTWGSGAGREEEMREWDRANLTSPHSPSTHVSASLSSCSSASSSSSLSAVPISLQGSSSLRPAGSSLSQKSSAMAADIWALGCLFYELLTGEFLFASDPFFYLRLTGRLPLLDDSHKERLWWNPLLIGFLLRILQRRPEKRPSAAEVVAQAHALLLAIFRELGEATASEPEEAENTVETSEHVNAGGKGQENARARHDPRKVAGPSECCANAGGANNEVVRGLGTMNRHDGAEEDSCFGRGDAQLVQGSTSKQAKQALVALHCKPHTCFLSSSSLPSSRGFYFGLAKRQHDQSEDLEGKRRKSSGADVSIPSLSRFLPSRERTTSAGDKRKNHACTLCNPRGKSHGGRLRTEQPCRQQSRASTTSSLGTEDCHVGMLAASLLPSPSSFLQGDEGTARIQADDEEDNDTGEGVFSSFFPQRSLSAGFPFSVVPYSLVTPCALPFGAAVTQPVFRDVEIYILSSHCQGECGISIPEPSVVAQSVWTSLSSSAVPRPMRCACASSTAEHWQQLPRFYRREHSLPLRRFSFVVDCRLPLVGWVAEGGKKRGGMTWNSLCSGPMKQSRERIAAGSPHGDPQQVPTAGSRNPEEVGNGRHHLPSGSFLLGGGGPVECPGARVLSFAAFAGHLIEGRRRRKEGGGVHQWKTEGVSERQKEFSGGEVVVEKEERRRRFEETGMSVVNVAPGSVRLSCKMELAGNEHQGKDLQQSKAWEKEGPEVRRVGDADGASNRMMPEHRARGTDAPKDHGESFTRVAGPDLVPTSHGDEPDRKPVSLIDSSNPMKGHWPMSFCREGNPTERCVPFAGKNNLVGEAFSRFLPVLFDFLREAAACGESVLFLDEEAPSLAHQCACSGDPDNTGGGRCSEGASSCTEISGQEGRLLDFSAVRTPPVASGVSAGCAVALVMVGLGLDPFRAVSLLSSQCSLAAFMPPAVRRVLFSLFFHLRRRSRDIGGMFTEEVMPKNNRDETREKNAPGLAAPSCAGLPVSQTQDGWDGVAGRKTVSSPRRPGEGIADGFIHRGAKPERSGRRMDLSVFKMEQASEAALENTQDDEELGRRTGERAARLSCLCGGCVWSLPLDASSVDDFISPSARQERMSTSLQLLPSLTYFICEEAATCLCDVLGGPAHSVPEQALSQPHGDGVSGRALPTSQLRRPEASGTSTCGGGCAKLPSAGSSSLSCPLQNRCGSYVAALKQRYGLLLPDTCSKMTWSLFSFSAPSVLRKGREVRHVEREDVVEYVLGLLARGTDGGLKALTEGSTRNSEEVSLRELLPGTMELASSSPGRDVSSSHSPPLQGSFFSEVSRSRSGGSRTLQRAAQFSCQRHCTRAQGNPAHGRAIAAEAGDGENTDVPLAARGVSTGAALSGKDGYGEGWEPGHSNKVQKAAESDNLLNRSAHREGALGGSGRRELRTEKDESACEERSGSERRPLIERRSENDDHEAEERGTQREWSHSVNEREESQQPVTGNRIKSKMSGETLDENPAGRTGECTSCLAVGQKGVVVTRHRLSQPSDVGGEDFGRAQLLRRMIGGPAGKADDACVKPRSDDFREATFADPGSSCFRQFPPPPWRLFRCRICRVLTHAVAVVEDLQETSPEALSCSIAVADVTAPNPAEEVSSAALGKHGVRSPRVASSEGKHLRLQMASCGGAAVPRRTPVLHASNCYECPGGMPLQAAAEEKAAGTSCAGVPAEEASTSLYGSCFPGVSREALKEESSSFRVMVAFPSSCFQEAQKNWERTADSALRRRRATRNSEDECRVIYHKRDREQQSSPGEGDSGLDTEEEADWDSSGDAYTVGRRPVLSDMSLGDVLFGQK
ncbi:pik3r4 kinase-related protein (incomplete catalytic triad) [Cystoisospora suis]|uniref:non-specific serine/threonine protein kinase n=1 Tax=Cystoisospora suis TaxID=483139 RepID=A0A2C6LB48_9APIC|nr:pik3r4 kinase-related protein (incomplete catalytic triad) [Cystoisospora suis]